MIPDPETTAELAEHTGPLAEPPHPDVAALWEIMPGLYLPDGSAIYGPHSLAERNDTYEVAEYSPGWVLIGDDGGGAGYLMRALTAGAPPPDGVPRPGEVYLLDLGALCPDVAAEGDLVTTDLVAWATGQHDDRHRPGEPRTDP
ncbi:hypothetical protein [Ruania alba]|nr:hypothetical protein [Ruania alba]